MFNKLLVSNLVEYGLEKLAADPCVFRLYDRERKLVTLVLGVYVDDLIVTGHFKSCEALRGYLNKCFPTKNLGSLSYYLGCEYRRDHKQGTLYIPDSSLH